MGFLRLSFALILCLLTVSAALIPRPGYPWSGANHRRHRNTSKHGGINVFDGPISKKDPGVKFGAYSHPLRPPEELADSGPIQTNKFFTNMLVDGRDLSIWTHPYSFWWMRDGISMSHPGSLTRSMAKRTNFLYTPSHVETLEFTAEEFSPESCHFETHNPDIMSINARVVQNEDSDNYLEVPLVYGMGMATAIYHGNMTPTIKMQAGIQSFDHIGLNFSGDFHKYIIHLNSGDKWVVYSDIKLMRTDGSTIMGDCTANNSATIQAAHLINPEDHLKYDRVYGNYAIGATVSGSVDGQGRGVYRITHEPYEQSCSKPLLIFALPHHVHAFSASMESMKSGLELQSTVTGQMMGMYSNYLEMNEVTPDYIGFFPWTSIGKENLAYGYTEPDADLVFDPEKQYSAHSMAEIRKAVRAEIEYAYLDDGTAGSTYFAGKQIDKLAILTFVAHFIARDPDSARQGLDKLGQWLDRFSDNRQPNPLVYDTSWKGLVSSAGLNGNRESDFGNTFYNDHHFHYGYFVHAAAVAVKVDQALNGKSEMLIRYSDFINTLVRDVANPSTEDPFFPVSRSFDWYTGHSWAKGLFSAQDGRDEESSSEDYHFAYGMKLWGKVSGDMAMEGRGNLMLGIMRRSINSYMLYSDGNDIVPQAIASNKVAGILLENKILYATWFGNQPEYVHGIHMLPITPISSFIRTPEFVSQEWEQKVGRLVDNLGDGWKGVLMLNLALSDPPASSKFFLLDDFNYQWLDGGQSRAWSIAYSAGVTEIGAAP